MLMCGRLMQNHPLISPAEGVDCIAFSQYTAVDEQQSIRKGFFFFYHELKVAKKKKKKYMLGF